jgi:hypothetical protein
MALEAFIFHIGLKNPLLLAASETAQMVSVLYIIGD